MSAGYDMQTMKNNKKKMLHSKDAKNSQKIRKASLDVILKSSLLKGNGLYAARQRARKFLQAEQRAYGERKKVLYK